MEEKEIYDSCTLCPRECRINRNESMGFCRSGSLPVVNLSMLHFGEEPIISGTSVQGSGAVFFEGCSLGCKFCQNYTISRGRTGAGREMNAKELADEFLKFQEKGAVNINLVTALHYTPTVAKAIETAKNSGLTIPTVVNSGGYEKVETLKMLDGLIDVYLPDMKFYSSKISKELTGIGDYFDVACKALEEMYRQTGPVQIENDLIKKGMVVRHLMLPGKLFDTKKVLDHLTENYGNNIYISLMNQYTPMPHLKELNNIPDYLFKTLNPGHYDSAADYLINLGQENAFVQDSSAVGDEMIPNFKKDC